MNALSQYRSNAMSSETRCLRAILLGATIGLLIILSARAYAMGESEHDIGSHITVIVHWVEHDRDIREAANEAGQPILKDGRVHGYALLAQHESGAWICMIWARKPRRWGDHGRMQTLGHELMHCLGYTHE